jgi:hypothetical protein
MKSARLVTIALLTLWSLAVRPTWAAAPASASPPQDARAQAALDLAGYWVSLITQNWQYRMIVPGPGEYADIPINRRAKQLADAWSAAADETAGRQCEAYGAAVIMRLPERLHIHWPDANELQVDTDAGMQTRLLHFTPVAAEPLLPSRQGYSRAEWVRPAGTGQLYAPPRAPSDDTHHGSLKVTTDHMLPGLLRKNGVPYGSQAVMTEWWDLRTDPTGQQWLSISTRVQDPEFLLEPYIYDSIFQREADDSKWDPSPCSLRS